MNDPRLYQRRPDGTYVSPNGQHVHVVEKGQVWKRYGNRGTPRTVLSVDEDGTVTVAITQIITMQVDSLLREYRPVENKKRKTT